MELKNMAFVRAGIAIVIGTFLYLFWPQKKIDNTLYTNQKDMTKILFSNDSIPEAFIDKIPIYQEYYIGSVDSSPNGMMLFEDGSVLRYSDVVVEIENGIPVVHKSTLEWRKEIDITLEGIQQIKELINNYDVELNDNPDPNFDVLVQFRSEDKEGKVYINGMANPHNYDFFTKVNKAISLNTINRNKE